MNSTLESAVASMMIMPAPNKAYAALSAADQIEVLGAVRKAMSEPLEVVGPLQERWEGFEVLTGTDGKINDGILVDAARVLLPDYASAIGMTKLNLQDPPAGVQGFEYCLMQGMWVCYHTYQLYEGGSNWVIDRPANKKGVEVNMVLQVHWHW